MMVPKDLYNVLTAVVPLYVSMFLAYASVKYFKAFTAEQCSGINRFVAIFAVPLLSFQFISRVDPFHLHFLFISADSLSKVLVLLLLFGWSKSFKFGSLDWSITLFSLTTLPNTLVIGIPLLKSMYGDNQEELMIQLVVMQCIVWYTLLLFLFEYRAAMNSVREKLSKNSTIGAERRSSEEDGVHVIVVKPPTENDLHRSQKMTKVVPELEGASRGEENAEELHDIDRLSNQELGSFELSTCSREDDSRVEGEKVEYDRISVLLIIKMVWHKVIRNPNFYASLLGISWALISSRWNIKKPLIIENSIAILSNTGLGMATFSLGLFMAMQPSIIACGKRLAAYAMLIRFVAGPAVMALASVALGLKGTTLKVSIVQAALPQGIVPFVFAKEYDLHPEVLSTMVIFGMIVSLPVTILYYIALGS